MTLIELDDITKNNKHVLEVINARVLLTSYPEEFYADALSGFSKYAYVGEVAIGAVKAKLDVQPHHSVPTSVYIQSLAVLEPYRKLGVGKKLVNYVVEEAKKSYVHEITLHVWTKQQDVREWYAKLGFQDKEIVPQYYKDQKLDQPDAVLMSMKF